MDVGLCITARPVQIWPPSTTHIGYCHMSESSGPGLNHLGQPECPIHLEHKPGPYKSSTHLTALPHFRIATYTAIDYSQQDLGNNYI